MTVDPDAEDPLTLYDTKWKQFEQDQWRIEERRGRINKPRLEWLIFSAIRAETGKEGDLGRLYVDFKDYGRSGRRPQTASRSEEHTSELQSLMRTSYAVFCLTKKT